MLENSWWHHALVKPHGITWISWSSCSVTNAVLALELEWNCTCQKPELWSSAVKNLVLPSWTRKVAYTWTGFITAFSSVWSTQNLHFSWYNNSCLFAWSVIAWLIPVQHQTRVSRGSTFLFENDQYQYLIGPS